MKQFRLFHLQVELVSLKNQPNERRSFALKIMKKKQIVETRQQTHILSEKVFTSFCSFSFTLCPSLVALEFYLHFLLSFYSCIANSIQFRADSSAFVLLSLLTTIVTFSFHFALPLYQIKIYYSPTFSLILLLFSSRILCQSAIFLLLFDCTKRSKTAPIYTC